jgi:integrase
MVERVEAIEREGLPGKANDFRAKVGAFLNWAASSGLIPANPLTGWRRARRTRAQRLEQAGRALDDAELPILWRAAEAEEDAFFGAYVRILLLSGQRRSETAAMRWRDVDLAAGCWTVPAEVTKAGRMHRVPLPPEAVALLRGLPRLAGTDLVFPGRHGRPMSGWTTRVEDLRRVTAREGMVRWTLHDLRRTVRTGLGRLGVDPQIAELLLNHAIGDELAATYDRGDYWRQRVEAASRWARYMAGLVDGQPEGTIAMLRRATG